MTSFKTELDRERLIIKQQEENIALEKRARIAEEKLKKADDKFERMRVIAYSDKPIAFRLDRIKKVLRESEGRNGALGHDLYA